MRANGVRAAQLAIAKNGVMKFSRAYTWAEAGYRVTERSDRFLLASCSKMFLEGAVQALYDSGKLKPATTVYPLLGFSHPADPRSDTLQFTLLITLAATTTAGPGPVSILPTTCGQSPWRLGYRNR